MKKVYMLLMVLPVISDACQRSQFSTAIRNTQNGCVTYTNQHQKQRIKTIKVKGPELKSDQKVEIASLAKESAILGLNHSLSRLEIYLPAPDSIRTLAPPKGTNIDFSARQVIKFKNGKTKTTSIVYQSADTLYYQSISKPDITQFVNIAQVDTVFLVRYFDPEKGKVVDIRKTEKLGLAGFILSFPGLVPLFGLPFAILAVIFGVVSLRKANRQPDKYLRNGKASLILGIIGLSVCSILLIYLAIAGAPGISM